jgi:hypothetical protein
MSCRADLTYVWRQDDGGRREVQLRDIEWLVEKIGGVELVQRSSPSLRWKLLRLLLGAGSEIHGPHAGGEASDAWARSGGCTGRRIVRLRGLVTGHGSWLGHPVRRLRLLLLRYRGAIGSGLKFWLRIASICRGGSAVLSSYTLSRNPS